jgi:hypothetical protein
LPPEVEKGGLFAPRLTAQVAYMKGACHASFSTIRKYIRDILGIKVSRGYLRKLIQKVTDALQLPYDELLKRLPSELWLNVDETGHKDNGVRFWTWCFRAETYTLFKREYATFPSQQKKRKIWQNVSDYTETPTFVLLQHQVLSRLTTWRNKPFVL